ncbi:phosphotyrosine protein phosphatase [Methyloceanibacter methanicus]|uniref:protein-tyrosine-phosphatase n=1 Tax=Methyloceanibacter methanicus TaxID=1774968 RepID=A0A1E3W644_9HYPH|nr:low molecular weight protein-tyrosine-phosphatase [Methyloceanibacter methanicus]ODS01210.1 phosphotyrosine protein phosphatase [Methyloceanibacter methanicus]
MTGQETNTPETVRYRLLFACLGNICRSPMAEGVFRRVAEEQGQLHLFEIDSAGMGDWHKGQAPDHRAQKAALARVDISGQSARKIELEDFEDFDLILAMDGANIADLQDIAPHAARHKIRRFLDYAPHLAEDDVPDPYYGGEAGFDHALDLIEAASEGLLAALLRPGEAAGER